MKTGSVSTRLEPRIEPDPTQHRSGPEAAVSDAARAPRYQGLLRQLPAEEKSALAELAHDSPRQSVPRSCAVRLLHLGLAELDCGRLLLTRAGRNAVVAMSGR